MLLRLHTNGKGQKSEAEEDACVTDERENPHHGVRLMWVGWDVMPQNN